MITGDPRISPNNDTDVKAVTSNDNIFKEEDGKIIDISGEIIKVVLISQAGSEGLDFKGIRQVHILEPYWNFSRIAQILGRAVRYCSHKALPEEQRSVDAYIYLATHPNEALTVDQYIAKLAHQKSKIIQEFLWFKMMLHSNCT
jgi:superfamily II DNA or RNA helicase